MAIEKKIGLQAPGVGLNRVTVQALIADTLPTNYFNGLKISPNSTNPTYQIDIGTGQCRSADDTVNIIPPSILTADITVSGVNGLDTGSEAANTWYYIWLIYDPVNELAASLLSASSTAPSMPSGYTAKRRIGSVRNDNSSDFIPFYQQGNGRDRWIHTDATSPTILVALSGGSATTWTVVDCSTFIPSTAFVGRFEGVSNLGVCEVRPNGWAADPMYVMGQLGIEIQVIFEMPTDSAQNVQYQVTTPGQLDLYVTGYMEEL